MKIRNSILFLWVFIAATTLIAQNSVKTPEFLSKASVSLSVIDLESNEILLEKDRNRLLIPASTMKLVTSVQALHHLGDDFRFKTELGYSGYIDEEGVLQGDLILTSYGDPTFFSSYFNEHVNLESIMDDFHKVIDAAGINCVNGTIIVDASFYKDDPINPQWVWQDIANYYGGGVWGFNFLDNSYSVEFSRSDSPDQLTVVKSIIPEIPNLNVDNRVATGEKGSGDQAYIFGGPNDYSRTIRGTIPPGKGHFTIKGSIPNPPLTFALLLMEGLENKGIGVYGDIDVRPCPEEIILLKSWKSPSLSSILEIMNHKSVNLFADGLYAYLSRMLEWETLSSEQQFEAIGLSTEECKHEIMLDGSGLSPRNILSSYFLCRLLKVTNEKNLHLENSLPILGKDGTLAYWPTLDNTDYTVKGKSGSMTGVQSLVGYIMRNDKPILAFAILVNNYSGSSKNVKAWMIDQLNEALSVKTK